jgi:eukaryotic-like serine/threonine-protein kinase
VTLDGSLPVPLSLNQDYQVVGSPMWGTEPILSPSGNEVIFYGNRSREPEKLNEWWIAPLNGSKPRRVRLPGVDQPNEMFPSVRGWTRTKDGRDWILYSTSTGNVWKLWRIMTSASGEIAAAPELLTSGTGVLDIGGSLSEDGKLVYGTWTFIESIYEIPADKKGQKLGPTLQIPFPEEADDSAPSLSRDGRWMEYAALRLGNPKTTRLRDLRTGIDRVLDDKGSHFYGAATSLSPDGSKVAFESECREGKWPTGYPAPCTFMLPAGGGKREQVCEFCRPGGFSSNGSILLIDRYSKLRDAADRIAAVELTTNTEKDFLRLPHKDLSHAFFSWDDRWVVFMDQSQIMIAPVGRGVAGNAAEWIAVTDGRHSDDKPQFSPDGNTVYYTSTRDGYLCIWAQELDPTTKRPVGAPAPFEHFHNAAGRDAAAYFQGWCNLTVARDKMLINLPRVSKDIWVVQVE